MTNIGMLEEVRKKIAYGNETLIMENSLKASVY